MSCRPSWTSLMPSAIVAMIAFPLQQTCPWAIVALIVLFDVSSMVRNHCWTKAPRTEMLPRFLLLRKRFSLLIANSFGRFGATCPTRPSQALGGITLQHKLLGSKAGVALANQRGSRCWRKTSARYGETGPTPPYVSRPTQKPGYFV